MYEGKRLFYARAHHRVLWLRGFKGPPRSFLVCEAGDIKVTDQRRPHDVVERSMHVTGGAKRLSLGKGRGLTEASADSHLRRRSRYRLCEMD